jgi:Fur family transcriptional regulator, ferric uptake regulator
MTQTTVAELHGRFRKRQLRVTKPRKIIVDVLGATKRHLSAEEVYLRVHKAYPTIGLTTVYRTLDLLEEMGIVAKLQFGDGRSRYELKENPKKPGHHHHLVCTSCKRIIEYDDFVDEEVSLIRKVERELSRKHGFHITGHVIQFQGVCTSCQKSGQSNTTA